MQPTAEELAGLSEEDRKILEDDAAPEPEPAAESESAAQEPSEVKPADTKQDDTPKEPTELEKLKEQVDNLNKALKQERYQARVMNQNAEAIKQQILEMRKAKEAPPKAPEFDDDPLEHTKEKLKEFSTSQDAARQKIEQMEAIQRQQQYAQHVSNLENEFKRVTPDYDDAFKYMVEFRKKEISNYGVEDEEVINREIQTNCFQLTATALQNGKNPAQVLYETAQMYGYKPAGTKKADTPPPATLGDVAKGQAKASQTLSKGGKDDATLNAEALLEMSGEDFDANWAKMFGKKRSSLL